MPRAKVKDAALTGSSRNLARPRPVAPDSPRSILDRILDTPALARAVPRLPPELLHRLIERAGVEECGALVALTTPGQLMRVLDLDLWRSGPPGRDERFDAARFGLWIEVLVDAGAGVAAEKLAGLDVDLVAAGLAQHARVFDRVAVTRYTTLDGDEIDPIPGVAADIVSEIGGYALAAKRASSWDAIVEALAAFGAGYPRRFDEVMRACVAVSSATPEDDGLHDLMDDGDQLMYEAAVDRDRRRERQGYATPAQARAFLEMSRTIHLDRAAAPDVNPIAQAYFRGIEDATPPDAEIVAVLREAGIVQPSRVLLAGDGAHPHRLAAIDSLMAFALENDAAAHARRTGELAFFANVLLAGCSIQGRPFTEQEAFDAAVAVCNCGLENWPAQWRTPHRLASSGDARLPQDFLIASDLLSVFQVGWTIVYREVTMFAAEELIAVLGDAVLDDRELGQDLDAVRAALTKAWRAGTPWRARDALDVIATLDAPAWAALAGLLDECPVMHAGLAPSRGSRAVSATAFELIAGNDQIQAVRRFLRALPGILGFAAPR